MLSAENKSVKTSLLWSFLEQGSSKIALLVIQLILARLLAPEVFGVMAILLVVVETMSAIAQGGLGSSLIQSDEVNRDDCTTAFWLSISLAAILYIIIFLCSPFIANVYEMTDLVLSLRILALSVFLSSFNSIQRSILQREMSFRSIFLSNISSVVISGCVGVAMAVWGMGLWALVAQALIQQAIACLVMFIKVPWRPSFYFSRVRARELLGYGWKVCTTVILGVFYTGISELIIGKVCNPAQLGYYSQGRKWPNAGMGVVTNAIQNVMFPVLSLCKNDNDKFKQVFLVTLRVGSYVVIPLCVLLALIAEPLLVLLLSEKWIPSVPVFQLGCIGYVLIMPQIVNLRAYMALGLSNLYLKLQVIKVTLGIFIISGVAYFTKDIYAVALSTCLLNYFCIAVIDMNPAKRVIGIGRTEQLKQIGPIVLIAVIAGLVSHFLTFLALNNILQILLQSIVFVAIYCGLSKLCRLKSYEELLLEMAKFMHRATK